MSTEVKQKASSKTKRKLPTPFSISPNPNSLYFTPALEAAVFRVRFTVADRQGLTVILGDVGVGKSSVIRYLHSEFDALEDTISVLIPTADFKSEYAMIQTVCKAFGMPSRKSVQAHQRELEEWLGEQYLADRNVVLFLDEAQKMKEPQLELVRAMLNFETDESKLIQVVLAGQLELRDRLLSNSQRALYNRLIAPTVLSPLTLEELHGMLLKRCEVHKIKFPFTDPSVERIFILTGGTPRSALRLCALAWEMAKLARSETVSPDLIDLAFKEMTLKDNEVDGGGGSDQI